ncbi:MAG: AI-2E family transporter [Kiritimatiellae bacterium]|jgi:predicted PurR-regulated permease PerM|nr:AI-2E family transporter [Kiritimatiellia bacterium]
MIDFTEGQKRTVASGLTALSVSIVVAFAVLVFWGIVKALAFAAPAIVPVIVGFFLSLFFRPYYQWWRRMVRNPTLALVAMLTTVFVPLGLVFWYAGAVLVDQLIHLINQGPELADQVLRWFRGTFPRLDSLLHYMGVPYEDFGYIYTKYGPTALKAGSGAVKCLLGVVTGLVTLIFFVFFLMTKERRGGEITSQMPFLKEETRMFLASQIDAFVEILVSFFQRQTVICLIEGLMYGTGFWLVGLPYGFLIGFALGVMNLIPLFGSVVCLPVALPLAYFTHGGSLTRLLLVLGVWLAGQALDGYLITPRIQGDKTGLGYAGVIFSFFFWSIVLGPVLGMLLAIPLSAFCVVLWRAVKARYIRPVV